MEGEVYRDVGGLYATHYLHEDNIRSALAYQPLPGDVFVVGYPKSGTTWMQHIVYNIFCGGTDPKDATEFTLRTSILELLGGEYVKTLPRPVAIRNYFPFHLQNFSKDAKYVYMCRNPYDTCVSFYHHMKHRPEYHFEAGTFEQFLDMFHAGKVEFGDYFNHLTSWYAHRNEPNVFLVTYENLRTNTRQWVTRIADFLGEEYGRRLREDPVVLDRVMTMISAEKMKECFNNGHNTLQRFLSLPPELVPQSLLRYDEPLGTLLKTSRIGDKVRKAVVGDWRCHFTGEQIIRMKQRIAERTRGSDLMTLWEDIGLP